VNPAAPQRVRGEQRDGQQRDRAGLVERGERDRHDQQQGRDAEAGLQECQAEQQVERAPRAGRPRVRTASQNTLIAITVVTASTIGKNPANQPGVRRAGWQTDRSIRQSGGTRNLIHVKASAGSPPG
jgi:hypothetical protein